MKLKSGKRGGKGARKVVLIRCSYTVCGLAGNREIGNDTEECPILEREPERYGLLSKFGGGEGRCRWTGWPRRATRSWSGHRSAVVTVAFAFLFAPVQGAISPSLALTTRVVAAHGPAVSAADIHHHHQPARSAQGKNHTDWVALSDWLATSSASSMTAHRFCLFVFFKRP